MYASIKFDTENTVVHTSALVQGQMLAMGATAAALFRVCGKNLQWAVICRIQLFAPPDALRVCFLIFCRLSR